MIIQHITIQNFGSILSYDAKLASEINIIRNRYIDDLAAAMAFLLCNQASPEIPEHWLQADTQISATIILEGVTYWVRAAPNKGRLQLSVVDPMGEDVTARYQYALSHTPEEDATEIFDGQDKTIPWRLCRYRNREEGDGLSERTRRLADTKTFRRYLSDYICNFRSEPINSKKNYQMTISSQGKFEVFDPFLGAKRYLSETEEKLFRYTCFLNIAEFWEGFEFLRDLHYERKPLMIRNFIEFIDESADISGLIARTQRLCGQTIILTRSMDEDTKKKCKGENNGGETDI